MKLFVVRHGETNFNTEHRYLGALDPELNATGLIQAMSLNSLLPPNLDVIVCSPLQRARQTAEILASTREMPHIIIDDFRERNVGVFEGLTQKEAKFQFPELWAQNITRQWGAAPTNGETIEAVVNRVANGLRHLHVNHSGKNVTLVAHGFVAKVVRAICRADFDDFFEWQLSNGSVCELVVSYNICSIGSLQSPFAQSLLTN